MPFWKRRKVIYTWDDNFSPTEEHGTIPNLNPDWTWVVPEDRYIELTNAWLRVQTAAGIHVISLSYELYSAQHRYFRSEVDIGLAQDTSMYFYLVQSGSCGCERASFESQIHWLPLRTRMIPGDRLRMFLHGAVSAVDYFTHWGVRYNRYDLT